MLTKSILPAFLFSILSFCSLGQVGIYGSYNTYDAPAWNTLSQDAYNDVFLNNGAGVGINYWFRLKNVRWEFTPEVNLSFASNSFANGSGQDEYSMLSVAFIPNSNIYVFDFKDDCNCPTFSKTDPFFKKGFFLQFGPQVGYIREQAKLLSTEQEETNSATVFGWNIGVGIDLGINDLITITPLVRYGQWLNVEWKDLLTENELVDTELSRSSNLSSWHFGVRIGLRFDEMNKYSYRSYRKR